MHRALLERRIRDVHARLVRAREDLAVLDEQLAVVMESADEARVRSLRACSATCFCSSTISRNTRRSA